MGRRQLVLRMISQGAVVIAGLCMITAATLQLQHGGADAGEWFLLVCGILVTVAALLILIFLELARRRAQR